MIKDVFVAIAGQLKNEVPSVAFIDLWNENLDDLTGGAVFPLPAVFVEFEDVAWRQQGNHTRMGDLGVRLHIITREVKYNGSEDSRMAAALARFDLVEEINEALLQLHGNNFTTLMLTNTTTNHNHAELVEDVTRYVSRVQSLTGLPPRPQPATPPEVNITPF